MIILSVVDKKNSLAFGFVLYNPEQSSYARIRLLNDLGYKIYIYDNSPDTCNIGLDSREFSNVNYLTAGKNLGLGVALSTICAQAYYDSYKNILFFDQDTIFNNIRLGNVNASEQKVIEAAKIANAHEFIKATENGYNTNIGDSGNKLSGGQKQRLSIARAILKNPEILILDEAFSAMDINTEAKVLNNIFESYKNMTIINIAHKGESLNQCDRIYDLDAKNFIDAK